MSSFTPLVKNTITSAAINKILTTLFFYAHTFLQAKSDTTKKYFFAYFISMYYNCE